MREYRYFRGGRDSYEAVEFDIKKRGQYITTCVVNVNMLICGLSAQPCGNGDDYKLTPEERLEVLEFVQAEREKIRASEEVKSLDGWHKSGLGSWEDYCKPGEKVTEDVVEYFADSVPPITYEPGFVQAGEPYSSEPDDDGRWRNTYTTFTVTNEKDSAGRALWLHNGCCFKGRTDNRVNTKTRLERLLDEIRGGVENNAGL